jgi:Cu/Zn superoxide dismutase
MAIERSILHQLKQLTKHSPGASLRRIATTAAMLSTAARGVRRAGHADLRAQLMPLNATVGGGAEGTVTLTINDDTLTINADVTGLSPAMHMIHIHGFTVGDKAATCASAAQDKDLIPDPRG